MRTCSQCRSRSPDSETRCVGCGADLDELSETAVALARLKANPRVGGIRVIPHGDCCPTCRAAEGEFRKQDVPDLPVQGCSHPLGCRCFYEPSLVELYP
ncbi:MAG TPA: hypothetical protein VGA52_13010 [Anaerolineales bacterium]|jgi:hypothetical protein